MSLKSKLEEQITIKDGDLFTYTELKDYCDMLGYKISNAERRLRELMNENNSLEPVRKKGYIKGWRVKKQQLSLI